MASEREEVVGAFLSDNGFGDARRERLPGDASTRSYERLHFDDGPPLILMNAPLVEEAASPDPKASEFERLSAGYNAMARLSASRTDAFVAAAQFLRSRGFSAPEVLAYDVGLGLAVVEDLGAGLYAHLLKDGGDEETLYLTAIEALAELHAETPPLYIGEDDVRWPMLTYDALALRTGADLFVEWLPKLDPRVVIDQGAMAEWAGLWRPLQQRAEKGAGVFTHRDYHAENLIWLPKRRGVARVGMVDFQDCVVGHPSWDLHSLLQDARRDVSPAMEAKALSHYFDLRPEVDASAFMEDYTALAAMNEARIIGIFSRLITRDKKPKYAEFLPRMWRHLDANLRHPALAGVSGWFDRHVPKEVRG